MSLPLTRRIAKTVLLTAAGAASVVGTAGAANAAELPTTADVGGLSTLDQGVATATEGAEALTPKSSNAPTAPMAETLPAPAQGESAIPETSFGFETSTPQAGVRVDSDNAGLAYEAGEASTALTQGQMLQIPDAQNLMPQLHTKGLAGDTTPETLPAPADPQQQSPQQDPSQDPSQDAAEQPAAGLTDPQTQAPLGGLAGTSGLGTALSNGLGALHLG